MMILRILYVSLIAQAPATMPAAVVKEGGSIELNISGKIDETLQDYVKRSLAQTGIKQVFVHIDSLGGDMDAGVEIATMILNLDVPTVCIDEVKAMSAAMMIMQSCDIRLMRENSIMMAHGVKVMPSGFLGIKQLKEVTKLVGQLNEIAYTMMLGRTIFPKEIALSLFEQDAEIYFDSETAKSMGAVDGIIPELKD